MLGVIKDESMPKYTTSAEDSSRNLKKKLYQLMLIFFRPY